jgi:hypothetical protein
MPSSSAMPTILNPNFVWSLMSFIQRGAPISPSSGRRIYDVFFVVLEAIQPRIPNAGTT